MLAIYCEWMGHKGEPPGTFPLSKLKNWGCKVVILDPSRIVRIKSDAND